MNDTISKKQTIIYISLIMCLFIFDLKMVIGWIVFLVVIGNIRRIPCDGGFLYFLRMTGYFFPYIYPLVIKVNVKNYFILQKGMMPYIIISIFLGVMYNCWDIKKYKVFFSEASILSIEYKTKYEIIVFIYCVIGSVIFEEIFYRVYILKSIDNPIIGCIVSSFLFVISHFSVPWSNHFLKLDYVRQFCIAGICSILLLLSSSIYPCIILHFLCNLNVILGEILRLERFYINPQKYENIKKNDVIYIDF